MNIRFYGTEQLGSALWLMLMGMVGIFRGHGRDPAHGIPAQ